MSVLAVLVFALQLALGFHCLKSGRGNTWLSIIMFVPVVGSILYIFTQLIPDLKQDPKAREAARKVSEQAQNWTDPQKHLRERLENLAVTDSDANRLALARECMEAQLWQPAEELLKEVLEGPSANDPHLLLLLAECLYAQERYAPARVQLEDLIAAHPDFRSADGHLLYAKTLEALNDSGVNEEYEALLLSYPGEEARVRYALYLQHQGDLSRAESLFVETVGRVRKAPRHYRKAQLQWVTIAERELQKYRPGD